MGYALAPPTFYPLLAAAGNEVFWSTATTVSQGAFVAAVKGAGAQNDYLGCGWYQGVTTSVSMHLAFVKSTDCGIITIYIDGSTTGVTPSTVDTYAASATPSTADIDLGVRAGGYHTIQLRMATKNAASTAYFLDLVGVTVTA